MVVRFAWLLLVCVGCGGGALAPAPDAGEDGSTALDAQALPESSGGDRCGQCDAASESSAVADAAVEGEASALDAGAEASCYNAAGLWVCDGGGFPGADQ